MAKPKITTVRVTENTAAILAEMRDASGARSIDEEINNLFGRVILNGMVAHKLAGFFIMNAAIIEAEKIPASVQMEIVKNLDKAQGAASAIRLVEETRARIIEDERRARYAGAAMGADPDFSELPDVIDLQAVLNKKDDTERQDTE